MKINKILTLIAIIPLVLLMSGVVEVDKARACSCAMPGSPQEHLARASAVFSGRVKNVEEASEGPFTSYTDPVEVVFEVKKVWKGGFSGDEEMIVTTARDGAMCGYGFVEGESYLVYANGEDILNVSLCGRTSVLDQASADLEYLNSLTPAEEGSPESGDEPVVDTNGTTTAEEPSLINTGRSTSTDGTSTEEGSVSGFNYIVVGLLLGVAVVSFGVYSLVRQRE